LLARHAERPWHQARRDPTGLSPDPAVTQEAVIQVFAAPAVARRGLFSVHTWIAVKPTGAPRFTRYEVLGFGVANGAPALRIDRMGPDNYWYGARPQIPARPPRRGCRWDDRAGARCRRELPLFQELCPWPGPNSNSFLAQVPDLAIQLPSNAVGKDFLPGGRVVAPAPSGSGFQVSLYGLIGILFAAREGLEVNLLGLSLGVDPVRPALKLPALGRLGMAGL
jgi:hypothetical protein